MKTSRSAGLTLVEVLIASVILVGVVLIAFATLFAGSTLSSKGSAASDLETRGTRFLGLCRDDMSAAQYGQLIDLGTVVPPGYLLGVDPAVPNPLVLKRNLAIAYQIPGIRDKSGVNNANGKVVFGYNCPTRLMGDTGFFADLVCYLRFEADTVFKESTSSLDAVQCLEWDAASPRIFPPFPELVNPTESLLPNQILKMDLNGDGDRTDTYVRGNIVKYVYCPATSPLVAAHGTGMKINGVQMTPLLLSKEVVSANVMLRRESSNPGDFYSDFDSHTPKLLSDIDALFRYVGASGGVDEAHSDPANAGKLTMEIVQTPMSTEPQNAKGVLIMVTHGDFDGTPNGFIIRKNKQLIRTRSSQANLGLPPPGP